MISSLTHSLTHSFTDDVCTMFSPEWSSRYTPSAALLSNTATFRPPPPHSLTHIAIWIGNVMYYRPCTCTVTLAYSLTHSLTHCTAHNTLTYTLQLYCTSRDKSKNLLHINYLRFLKYSTKLHTYFTKVHKSTAVHTIHCKVRKL